MPKLDVFTLRRLCRFIDEHRHKTGQYATLKDLAENGFEKEVVDRAERDKVILELPVNLTNGSVVKGYKVRG